MIDPAELLTLLDRGGVLMLLLIIIVGGYRRWWVWGWQLDAALEDAAYWRSQALRALEIGEAAVGRHDEQSIRRRFVDDDDAVKRRREARGYGG